MTSEREKLVLAACGAANKAKVGDEFCSDEMMSAALDVTYEWLREVTPEMVEAWIASPGDGDLGVDAKNGWLAMLAASPLAEPHQDEPSGEELAKILENAPCGGGADSRIWRAISIADCKAICAALRSYAICKAAIAASPLAEGQSAPVRETEEGE